MTHHIAHIHFSWSLCWVTIVLSAFLKKYSCKSIFSLIIKALLTQGVELHLVTTSWVCFSIGRLFDAWKLCGIFKDLSKWLNLPTFHFTGSLSPMLYLSFNSSKCQRKGLRLSRKCVTWPRPPPIPFLNGSCNCHLHWRSALRSGGRELLFCWEFNFCYRSENKEFVRHGTAF